MKIVTGMAAVWKKESVGLSVEHVCSSAATFVGVDN